MRARLVFNALVHQYLIPGIQIGAKVSADSATGEIRDIFCASRPIRPDLGCLKCNGLITASQLQEEAISEEEREAQRYVQDPAVTAPSVITLNAIAAVHATNDFLFAMTDLFKPDVAREFLRWFPRTNEFVHIVPRKDQDCLDCGLNSQSRFARGDSRRLPTKIRPHNSMYTPTTRG